MNFSHAFSTTEWCFLVAFAVGYLFFLFRVLLFAKRLRSSANAVVLKLFLRCLAFSFLFAALLGPHLGEEEGGLQAKGKDIFFLVDVSDSMNTTDVQPSRIEKVKLEINRFLDTFPENRFGLIVFTSGAYLQCPLTLDHNALKTFVEALNTSILSPEGTVLSPGLELALEKFSTTSLTSKVIVLISDGETHQGLPFGLNRKLANAGIQVFTIGVGTDAGGNVLEKGVYLKNENGMPIVSKLNRLSLQKLAIENKGAYFEVSNKANNFQDAGEKIRQLTDKLLGSHTLNLRDDKFQYFLAAGLLLLAIDILFPIRILRL